MPGCVYELVEGSLLRRMQPIELAYVRGGAGPTTLICLHSISAASSSFTGLFDGLNGHVELIGLDLRGFGSSHRPTHEYAIDLWVDDVITFLAEVPPALPPVAYGHGLGACIALALARRGALARVAVSGVALAPGEPSALGDVITAGERGEPIAVMLEELTGAPAAADDLTPQIVARAGRAWQSFDGRSLATGLDVPLLVLAGEDDALTPLDIDGGASWLAAAAGARLVSVPGGHELPSTQPAGVANALLDFLDNRKE